MKKIVVLIIMFFFLVGCGNDVNEFIENGYISKNDYTTIYNRLSQLSNSVQFTPTDDYEEEFYELIEAIVNDHSKFSNEELTNLYNLINIEYSFKYNTKRYDNDDFNKDLNTIESILND